MLRTLLASLFVLLLLAFQLDEKSLKQVYKDHFDIGVALGSKFYFGETNPKASSLIQKHFSVYTPENDMKSVKIHPEWHRYDFLKADRLVELAKQNNAKLIGHTLIWHSQLSSFIHENISADSLKLFMKDHISTVAGHFKGKIYGWDVVNEALNEDGSLRNSVFYRVLGEQYIVDAFKLAQQADPSAQLNYNDYNIEQPQKREGAIALVKMLKKEGVKIDGIGIQGHWNINKLPLKEIEESIIAFHELGLNVMITELDISVLPNPWDLEGAEVSQSFEGNEDMNPYSEALPSAVDKKLAEAYQSLFAVLLKHSDKVSRVTFWGLHDGSSWLNNWPIKGRTNYPLLFDRNLQPKKAFEAVINY